MIVWIDPLGECISQTGYAMRWFEHLAGIERVEVRVVVAEAVGGRKEDALEVRLVWVRRGQRGEVGESGLELVEGFLQNAEAFGFGISKHGQEVLTQRRKEAKTQPETEEEAEKWGQKDS